MPNYCDQLDKCSICLEKIIDECNFITLNCNHYFHLSCIMKYVITSIRSNTILNCPLCRDYITKDIFYYVYKGCYDLRKTIKKDISKLQGQIYIAYFKFQLKRLIKQANMMNTFKYLTDEEELVSKITNKKILLNTVDNRLKYLDRCMFYI